MKASKRHESLIPLSREHHYALMLCLRINRGLRDNARDAKWLRSKARLTTLFFESDLVTHFRAEEEILFPAMRGIAQATELIAELGDDHRKLKTLVQQLQAADTNSTEATLREFAALLRSTSVTLANSATPSGCCAQRATRPKDCSCRSGLH